VGYIPTPDRYDVADRRYSYPAHWVPYMLGEFPFRPDAGHILVDAMAGLAH
jgi:hypothetical protein